MSTQFDHRVVRNPHDSPLGPIQRDGNLRGLMDEFLELFLESGRRTIHGCDPQEHELTVSKPRSVRNLPRNLEFPH